jgi:hypothetical protein
MCRTNPIPGGVGWPEVPGGVGRSCKTNPISPGRRRVTAEIVQNEAKLGETGACGQRQLSCGASLDRE